MYLRINHFHFHPILLQGWWFSILQENILCHSQRIRTPLKCPGGPRFKQKCPFSEKATGQKKNFCEIFKEQLKKEKKNFPRISSRVYEIPLCVIFEIFVMNWKDFYFFLVAFSWVKKSKFKISNKKSIEKGRSSEE